MRKCEEAAQLCRATPRRLMPLTVNASSLVAGVGTVVHLVALLGAMDAGAVAALELIRATHQQGCRENRRIRSKERLPLTPRQPPQTPPRLHIS